MSTEWYYLDGESMEGPLTSNQITRLVLDKTITADTLIRKGENGKWHHANRVRRLADIMKEVAATPVHRKFNRFLEVRSVATGQTVRIRDIAAVTQLLIDGELTRHDEARWIEPKPKKPEARESTGSDTYSLSKSHVDDDFEKSVAHWSDRRQWRSIGLGWVPYHEQLAAIYRPDPEYARYWSKYDERLLFSAWLTCWPVVFVLALPFAIAWGMSWEADPHADAGNVRGVADGILVALARSEAGAKFIGTTVGVFGAFFGSSILGAAAGAGLGYSFRPLLRKLTMLVSRRARNLSRKTLAPNDRFDPEQALRAEADRWSDPEQHLSEIDGTRLTGEELVIRFHRTGAFKSCRSLTTLKQLLHRKVIAKNDQVGRHPFTERESRHWPTVREHLALEAELERCPRS